MLTAYAPSRSSARSLHSRLSAKATEMLEDNSNYQRTGVKMSQDTLLDKARKIINDVDCKMRELFIKRMQAAEMVAEYKKERGLGILDSAREAEVISRNSESIEDDVIREYYVSFLKNNMSVSRAYQSRRE